jgi:hypothetical protein
MRLETGLKFKLSPAGVHADPDLVRLRKPTDEASRTAGEVGEERPCKAAKEWQRDFFCAAPRKRKTRTKPLEKLDEKGGVTDGI